MIKKWKKLIYREIEKRKCYSYFVFAIFKDEKKFSCSFSFRGIKKNKEKKRVTLIKRLNKLEREKEYVIHIFLFLNNRKYHYTSIKEKEKRIIERKEKDWNMSGKENMERKFIYLYILLLY